MIDHTGHARSGARLLRGNVQYVKRPKRARLAANPTGFASRFRFRARSPDVDSSEQPDAETASLARNDGGRERRSLGLFSSERANVSIHARACTRIARVSHDERPIGQAAHLRCNLHACNGVSEAYRPGGQLCSLPFPPPSYCRRSVVASRYYKILFFECRRVRAHVRASIARRGEPEANGYRAHGGVTVSMRGECTVALGAL